MTFDLSLYLVLDRDLCRDHSVIETTVAAIRGGATMVQLRDKNAHTDDMIKIGHALMAAMAGSNVPLIVNDNIEVALAIKAHGLHIGQDDMPVARARQQLGDDKILGLSVESESAMQAVDPALVDYIGIGPVFATATKPGHKPAIGLDGLKHLVGLSPLPAVAIGGLKTKHANAVMATGAQGMAVVSAICGQPAPETASRTLADAILAASSAS
ncbi:thiamine phosphate synthase [Thalassospira mesophila]|uniref:Thiamine-phosphate synthase n=1 Tax=Thalassospira mesophila TaxID=1293891 RepID=A0A1Y2L3Y2_9PROT|nr:thiamine phosphate synthase [Thalassospira mesophila]OSQ40546.1 thiamine-phosphate synthase [Thalassospira mesophila]